MDLLKLYPSVSRRRGRTGLCFRRRSPNVFVSRSHISPLPQRRLPAPLVQTIWKHYFESFLIDCSVPASPVALMASAGTKYAQLSRHDSSEEKRTDDLGVPHTPRVEENAELTCMQWLVTDCLRHDLACLKERYDEVLATSLSMPQTEQTTNGFGFNPAPVLKAIRGELQRLNNMPLDYLARVIVKEMKGVGEDEDELSVAATPAMRRSSASVHQSTSPAGVAMPSAPHTLNDAAATLAPPSSNPLDKPVAPPGPSLTPRKSDILIAPPSARQLPPLSFDRFSAHFDFALKNLFDRYYRKGYWVLFSLNLVHHQRKVTAKFAEMNATPAMRRGAAAAGETGTWSDRISNAMAATAQENRPIGAATPIRRRMHSESRSELAVGRSSVSGRPAPPSRGGQTPSTKGTPRPDSATSSEANEADQADSPMVIQVEAPSTVGSGRQGATTPLEPISEPILAPASSIGVDSPKPRPASSSKAPAKRINLPATLPATAALTMMHAHADKQLELKKSILAEKLPPLTKPTPTPTPVVSQGCGVYAESIHEV